MAALTFSCPRTGGAIATGVELDKDTLRMVRRIRMHLLCAHCGGEHTFRVDDGRLEKTAA